MSDDDYNSDYSDNSNSDDDDNSADNIAEKVKPEDICPLAKTMETHIDQMTILYRYVSEKNISSMELGSSRDYTIDNYTYSIRSASYPLVCLNEMSFNVDKYLRSEPFAEKSNIQGFLTYDEIDRLILSNERTTNDTDFLSLAKEFRHRSRFEGNNRAVFVTYMLQESHEPYELPEHEAPKKILIGDIEFLYIKCLESGRATVGTITFNPRNDDVDVVRESSAQCFNDKYPKRECPDEPIAVRLGELMPVANDKEINLIGVGTTPKTTILGVVIDSVSVYDKVSKTTKVYNAHDIRKDSIACVPNKPVLFDEIVKILFDKIILSKSSKDKDLLQDLLNSSYY